MGYALFFLIGLSIIIFTSVAAHERGRSGPLWALFGVLSLGIGIGPILVLIILYSVPNLNIDDGAEVIGVFQPGNTKVEFDDGLDESLCDSCLHFVDSTKICVALKMNVVKPVSKCTEHSNVSERGEEAETSA